MNKNNYKQNLREEAMKKGEKKELFFYSLGKKIKLTKKAQLSVYIILALVIVVFGILIYFFYPRLNQIFSGAANPGDYLVECIRPELDKGLETILKQGGYLDPEGYIEYNGVPIKYLCYTSKYFARCYVQQPLLVSHVEKELAGLIEKKTIECSQSLKSYYDSRGYQVNVGKNAKASVALIPNGIDIRTDIDITITKETTQEFKTFRMYKASEIYMLLITATSIIDFESTYGDSEVKIFMDYYPELQLRKTKLIEGTTIYRIKNLKTSETFSFASRSLAWPPGYGVSAQ